MTRSIDLEVAASSGKRYDLTLRSGEVLPRQKVAHGTSHSHPENPYVTSAGVSYTRDGYFLNNSLESSHDIMKMEPVEEVVESDPINPDLHTAAFSGKRYNLTLRSGTVCPRQKVIFNQFINDQYPQHLYWTAGGFSYTQDGRFLAGELESQRDIVKMEPVEEVAESDPINPDHYRNHPSGVECIQITEHLPFNRGNAIKYLWRAGSKGCPIQDLRKAAWYIEREIRRLQNA